jgi:FkbH-like protein
MNNPAKESIRAQIEQLVADERRAEALARLVELWSHEPTAATANFVASCFASLSKSGDPPALKPLRLAILRSFTVEPIVPLLRAAAFLSGIELTVHLGEFNAYTQEILDEQSALYRFAPDAVILAVQAEDLAPDLWTSFADLTAESASESATRCSRHIANLISSFRRQSQASLIVHNMALPTRPTMGLFDAQSDAAQSSYIRQINREIRDHAAQVSGVYLLDYDALVARHGRKTWRDERKWLTARLPLSAANLVHLAKEWHRFIPPLTGKLAKCAVVDLDNTLWGGIVGEDGVEGLKLGAEYPGAAFRDVQRALLDLSQRGIILAVCSKNNQADVQEVFDKHPGMLLKPEHFAALRINWLPKSENLKQIAAELNIGLDSLAFIDDNPVERQQIRCSLPDVMVVELPDNAGGYAAAVRDFAPFERLTLVSEDKQRAKYYAAKRQARALEDGAGSREDFYRSLEQRAIISAVTPMTLERVAQLTNKTNQFNLTTRRYSEQQVEQMASKANWEVWSIQIVDRFVDNGIVGVTIFHTDAAICEIDTFLLSCRVIARTVETALLAHVVAEARRRGAKQLRGWFLPTKKNAPAASFYESHGFEVLERADEGTLYGLDLESSDLQSPPWIEIEVAAKTS